MLLSPPLDTSVFELNNIKRVVLSCFPSIKCQEASLSDKDWETISKDYINLYTPKELSSGIFLEQKNTLIFNLEKTFSKNLTNGQYHPYPSDIHLDIPFSYGVCDNYQQILDRIPELISCQNRKFFIILTEYLKSDQPKNSGWRWCKWGPYIGSQNSIADYLFDEPYIDKILCFQIYQFDI